MALATVIDGPNVGAKFLVGPAASPSGTLGHPELDRVVTPRRPRRARSGGVGHPALRPGGADHAGGPRRSADRARVHRVACAAPADVDLRGRRLHRRARPGRQGARLPGHGVRRARGVRHPPPLPDGRRGARHVADTGVRRTRRHARTPRRGVHPDPRPQVRRSRDARRAGHAGRLHRRDGQPHARTSKRMAAPRRGGRHRRRTSSTGSFADRARHRRPHARGDRGVDLRGDHRPAHRTGVPSLRDGDGAIHS